MKGDSVSRERIGYDVYKLGLSNQKLALLGLFSTAADQGADVVLPRLSDFSTKEGSKTEHAFSRIFDLDSVKNFAKDFNISVFENGLFELIPASDLFIVGHRVSLLGHGNRQSIATQFWKALKPSKEVQRLIEKVSDRLSAAAIGAIIQMRIEPDWQKYVSSILKARGADDVPVTAYEIFKRFRQTFPSEAVAAALLTCDEANVPIEEIRKLAEQDFNLSVYFKGDFLDESVKAEESLIRSVIDFELARECNYFVGTSRSTFANTLFYTKAAREPNGSWSHFVYTNPDEGLVRREVGVSEKQVLRERFVHRPYVLDDTPTATRAKLQAHISAHGDYNAQSSFIRPVSDRLKIECITINSSVQKNQVSLEYRARLSDLSWTSWTAAGNSVGTIGKSRALTGFSLRLASDIKQNSYAVILIAKFEKNNELVVALQEEPCTDGDRALVGLQIIIRPIRNEA